MSGPPASGKGTQIEMLKEKIPDITIISPGDMLRHNVKKRTKIGKIAQGYMRKGLIVPEEIVEKMLLAHFKKIKPKSGLIFDGYPRNMEQLQILLKYFKSIKNFYTVLIDVSDKKVINRIVRRRVCDCGASYNLDAKPPKKRDVCDICGKKLYRRIDDRLPIIRKRLKYYHQASELLFEYFKKQKKFIKIDGEQGIENTHKAIMKLFV